MTLYNNIKEVVLHSLPFPNDRGRRWKWSKDIPDEALWPQCTYCSRWLKLKPVGYYSRIISSEKRIELLAIRVCTHCQQTDYRKYYGEVDDLSEVRKAYVPRTYTT